MQPVIAFLKESRRIAIWLVVAGAVMTTAMAIASEWRLWVTLHVGALTILLWLFLWLGNAYLSDWLDERFSWHTHPGRRFTAGIVGMLVYSLGAVYMLILFFRHVVGFDVGNDLNGTFYTTLLITTLISMFITSRSFLFNWRKAAIDAEQLKQESVKAQYESLRNQVNPHFLFNSLNALTNLVHQNPDEAVQFIKQLSDVYRYVLETRDKELVPMEEELKFLKSYLFLQQIRFGDKLRLELQANGLQGRVAPLALQMLVENAIKHNIIAEDQPLSVRVHVQDGFIWVSNTLQRKMTLQDDTPGGIGLENIRKRYGFLSDRPVQVVERNGSFAVGLPMIAS